MPIYQYAVNVGDLQCVQIPPGQSVARPEATSVAKGSGRVSSSRTFLGNAENRPFSRNWSGHFSAAGFTRDGVSLILLVPASGEAPRLQFPLGQTADGCIDLQQFSPLPRIADRCSPPDVALALCSSIAFSWLFVTKVDPSRVTNAICRDDRADHQRRFQATIG